MPVTDVASIAQFAVTSQAGLLRRKLAVVAIGSNHKADQAVADMVAKAAGTGKGQVIDIKA